MKKTLKSLISQELISTLNESMIRVNGGMMGGVETMKDKPPFASEEQWMIKHGLKEDRFGHKITALGNQIYIQLDKMEQLLSGKEKNDYMKARSKFWKITKTAMEAEEQKQ